MFHADFHFIWGKMTFYEGLERQTDRKIGQTVTFDPASSSAANPAPLRRERELHSNTPNWSPRDATVAVAEEKGGRRGRRTETYSLPPKSSEQGGHTASQRHQSPQPEHPHRAHSASRRLTAPTWRAPRTTSPTCWRK